MKSTSSFYRRRTALIIFALAAANIATHRLSGATPEEACGKYAQQFYDTYFAKLKKGNEYPVETIIRKTPETFTPELLTGLKEDLAASRKSPGEIVGLDFDPILATQDPAEKYVIGKVSSKKDHYYVEVYGVRDKKKNPKPNVIAELVNIKGQWVFSNFLYPENPPTDLLSVLKVLKKDRAKYTK